MARPRRVGTAIRFEPAIHEVLKETAQELGVGVNWLVNKLCEEGLARIDLTNFSLVRPQGAPTLVQQRGLPEGSDHLRAHDADQRFGNGLSDGLSEGYAAALSRAQPASVEPRIGPESSR